VKHDSRGEQLHFAARIPPDIGRGACVGGGVHFLCLWMGDETGMASDESNSRPGRRYSAYYTSQKDEQHFLPRLVGSQR
jgi:hypothetical protein